MSFDISQTLEKEALQKKALKKREAFYGNRITFSPKVFIPLTKLCQDKCGYCTFAEPPAHLESPFMSLEDVLESAKAGARAGCKEALFTLGERPELRYPIAARWLQENGFSSTVEYLARASQMVLDETGLLPHSNAGALYPEELKLLRKSCASQGMMLESLNPNLKCHTGSPDKTPERRLATLEDAGKLGIAFTTGILVGIGEDLNDRIEALEAIARSHGRYGHIQEVIIQNFLPKPDTKMHKHSPCPPDVYLEAIALARLILPGEIHLQAPPNLSEDFQSLLAAGIDDWGGVSPLTPDFVNPERPWPELRHLTEATEDEGCHLAARLTIYPEYAKNPEKWLDPSLEFPVLDLSDAEGLAREPLGDSWYSGAPVLPPDFFDGVGVSFSSSSIGSSAVREVLEGIMDGQEAGEAELLQLFSARGKDAVAVAMHADELRKQISGEDITWVSNRNINYTNICTFKCKFCGFSKGPLSLNLRGTPYLLDMEEISQRSLEAWELGATEVCLQGGIHPDFDGEYYLEVTRAVKKMVPDIHIHGFTALEVMEGARRLEEPLDVYLERLKSAGLRSLPGTAAEILDDEIRRIICPDKITTDEWLEVHQTAHQIGLRSNVTIMFGTVESPIHWVRHILRTRELQKETGGFTEFVGLPFVHMAAPIYLQKKSRRGPTFRETVLMHSIARIAYQELIPNIQVSWVKLGLEGARQILMAGANDLGGTLINENISRAAGAEHGQMASHQDFLEIANALKRPLSQRTTLYEKAIPAL